MNFIETYSGRRFEPLNPDPNQLDIVDIAHALSNQCRFSGHTRTHYSVAEHCVRVADYVEATFFDTDSWRSRAGGLRTRNRFLRSALLHDACEAYLVDVPAPLKGHPSFAFYRDAEEALIKVIADRYDAPYISGATVAEADAVLLATEARDVMPYIPAHWSKLAADPLPDRIEPWPPRVAKTLFLETFYRVQEV